MIEFEWPVDRGAADRAAGRRSAAKGMLVARSSRRAAASRARGAVRIDGDSDSLIPSVLGAQPVPEIELDALGRELHRPLPAEVGQHGLERLLLRHARVERLLPAE